MATSHSSEAERTRQVLTVTFAVDSVWSTRRNTLAARLASGEITLASLAIGAEILSAQSTETLALAIREWLDNGYDDTDDTGYQATVLAHRLTREPWQEGNG